MSPDHEDDYITRRELVEFKAYLKELADEQTRTLDERLKALTWRGLLALGVSVGLLRFNVPDPVTVGAIGVAIVASVAKAISVVIGGRSL